METGKEDFYFMKLKQFSDDIVIYDSLHDLLDRYYDARGERERVKQRANDQYASYNNNYKISTQVK